jgi:hypothetical protein
MARVGYGLSQAGPVSMMLNSTFIVVNEGGLEIMIGRLYV